jgi:membrane-anchored glycerophosphoryl diester phosphodiesterase (GDPDase)
MLTFLRNFFLRLRNKRSFWASCRAFSDLRGGTLVNITFFLFFILFIIPIFIFSGMATELEENCDIPPFHLLKEESIIFHPKSFFIREIYIAAFEKRRKSTTIMYLNISP